MKTYTDNLRSGYDTNLWDTRRAVIEGIKLVEDPIVNNNHCLSIGLESGYNYQRYENFKDTERNELTEKRSFRSSVGEVSWCSIDVCFPNDFVIDNNRLVFMQWKLEETPPTHSPILSIKYINGSVRFQIGETGKKENFKKKIDLRGRWNRFVVGLYIDNKGIGWIKGYCNNELVIDYKGILKEVMYSDRIYMKFGIYRDSIDYSQQILFKDIIKTNNTLPKMGTALLN